MYFLVFSPFACVFLNCSALCSFCHLMCATNTHLKPISGPCVVWPIYSSVTNYKGLQREKSKMKHHHIQYCLIVICYFDEFCLIMKL